MTAGQMLGYRPDSIAQRAADYAAGNVYESRRYSAGLVRTENRDKFDVPVRDQMQSNFCVRFAVARAMEYCEVVAGRDWAPFSPLFHAWNDAMSGDQGLNVGTQIYLSAEAAQVIGLCSEDREPWELSQPHDYLQRMKVRPSPAAYAEAGRHQVVKHSRVRDGDVAAVLDSLQRGNVLVLGVPVREGFWKTRADGIISNVGAITGWHAMLCRDAVVIGGAQFVEFDNSWSARFGDQGRVRMTVTQLAEFRDGRVFAAVE